MDLFNTKKKSIIAMLSVCALAPILPAYTPLPVVPQIAEAASEQAKGIDYLVLVNKNHKLPDDYEANVPLVIAKNSMGREFQIERDTYAHFVELRDELLKQGIQIELDSIYRSVARQQEIVKEFTEKYGADYVRQYVAVPGYSEHHTGLAVDICLVVDGKVIDDNDEMIAQKEIFAKIHPLLAKHGFILRYMPGKENITGYSYEPWHFRYVGQETAQEISSKGLTLEEYLNAKKSSADSLAIKDERATADYWVKKNQKGDTECLTQAEIVAANQEMRTKSVSLTDLEHYPKTVDGTVLKEMILDAQQDFREEAEPGEHYDKGGKLIRQADYDLDKDNCNLDKIPVRTDIRYGVITQRSDMRLLPTAKYYFDDASFQHYDDLQGTAIDPCEPVLVMHESRDRQFAFVVGRYYKGWVNRKDIGFTDKSTWKKYVSPKNFLVVVDHKKKVHVNGSRDVLFQMGSIIPLKSSAARGSAYKAILPVSVNGRLSEVTVPIKKDDTVNPGYLPCTPNNFVRQSLKFRGDIYGWGGMEESVDCSAFVQDVYRSMGILLPRDADQQELAMNNSVSLAGLATADRYGKVGEAPVGALLFKPGHVMLYLGRDAQGTPLVIHSASSYFTFAGGKASKHYIRQVLVSDLSYQNGKGIKTIDGMTSIGSIARRNP